MLRRIAGVALLAASCAAPDPIEIVLVHSRDFVPDDLGTVEVRVLDEAGARVASGRITGAQGARGGAEILDADRLVAGRTYVVALAAAAPFCARGRAVGRSLPFVHREGPYDVSVSIGCADAFESTRGAAAVARVGHTVATMEGGDAAILGGAGEVDLGAFERVGLAALHDVTAAVEYYDPRTGLFTAGPSLIAGRFLAAAVPLPGDGVAVVGGVLGGAVPTCAATVEVARDATTAAISVLTLPRCSPGAARLRDSVVIAGGAALRTAEPEIEVWSTTLGAPIDPVVLGAGDRAQPNVIALADGASALVVGGTIAGGAAAELVRTDGSCAGGERACATEIAMEGAPLLGLELSATAYVECPGRGGTAWIFGGRSNVATQDAVWCYRDEPGVAGVIARVGALPEPRHLAIAQRVGGPRGPRVLLVGGTAEGRLPYDDALIVELDPCSCAPPASFQHVDTGFDGLLVFHAASALADGSVLVVGGARVALRDLIATATRESRIFFPDTEPP